jgi:hypothetical protein
LWIDDEVGELVGVGFHGNMMRWWIGIILFLFCVKFCQKENIYNSENGILYCKLPFLLIKKSPKWQPKKKKKKPIG